MSATADDLFQAARTGDLAEIARVLAADPALLNARNSLGQSAVMLAKYHRKQPAVDLLLSRKPDLTLHEACAAGSLDQVRAIVSARGSKVIDTHAQDGFTPLALACFFGQTEIAQFLVDQGANLNLAATNQMKVAPIHAAAAARNLAIVEILVKAGADVKARQHQGWTALHAAAQHGDATMLLVLLEAGADRTARSDNGQTPLDLALTGGHAEAAAALEA